ncbi:MAG: hypothetical protein U5K81_01345 [Trueperaceae bacterium]|nr:hypothetical protein [Trueperaceae bacterium]
MAPAGVALLQVLQQATDVAVEVLGGNGVAASLVQDPFQPGRVGAGYVGRQRHLAVAPARQVLLRHQVGRVGRFDREHAGVGQVAAELVQGVDRQVGQRVGLIARQRPGVGSSSTKTQVSNGSLRSSKPRHTCQPPR